MIDTKKEIGYGPFGSTSRTDGPKRLCEEEQTMHDNPRPSEEEEELAQTGRMDEEEDQRSGYAPTEAADEDEE
jgi:hypothetical protein